MRTGSDSDQDETNQENDGPITIDSLLLCLTIMSCFITENDQVILNIR